MSTGAQSRELSRVPFVDLGPSHDSLKSVLLEAIGELVDSGAFINGPQVREFEAAFASFCGANQCVGTASGLDALRLGLIASGLESGDEVILPAATFIATAEAVSQAGGTPVLADVSDTDYNLDPAAAEAAVTSRTRFLLPVHLYGQLADMRALRKLAQRRGLEIIEDACQAHGASRDGIGAGHIGNAAAFSFYPGKNLGAFGDAGALVTASPQVADTVRALREHGQRQKYRHDAIGWTARLDTIQAAVLLRKLPRLRQWNAERRAAAAYYLNRLSGIGDLGLPRVPGGSQPVWHLFVIRTARPEALAAFLDKRGIATARHYPQPIHLTDAYRWLGNREGSFSVSEKLSRQCLSLPIFPGIREEQLATVCRALEDYFARG